MSRTSRFAERAEENFDEEFKPEEKGGKQTFSSYFSTKGYDKVEFLPLEEKKTEVIDIIPFVVSDQHPDYKKLLKQYGDEEDILQYELKVFVHKGIGVDNKNSCICPLKTFGKPCPICEAADLEAAQVVQWKSIKGQEDDPHKTIYNSLKAKERSIMDVVLPDAKDGKHYIFDYSTYHFSKNFKSFISNCRAARKKVSPYDITDDGYSFVITPAGMPENSSFKKKLKPGAKAYPGEIQAITERRRESGEGYDDSIVDEAYPLDKMLNVLSYEEIDNLFKGGEVEEDHEETLQKVENTIAKQVEEAPNVVEEAPRRRRKKPAGCPFGHTQGEDFYHPDWEEDCQKCEKEHEAICEKCEEMYNAE